MSLLIYQNSAEVQNATTAIEGLYLSSEEINLIESNLTKVPNDALLDIYFYDIRSGILVETYKEVSLQYYKVTSEFIEVDIPNLLSDTENSVQGIFRIVCNLYTIVEDNLYIQAISPSRTEVAVQSIVESDTLNILDSFSSDSEYLTGIHVDIKDNLNYLAVNAIQNINNSSEYFIKLHASISPEILVRETCRLVKMYLTVSDKIRYTVDNDVEYIELEPNLNINLSEHAQSSGGTGYTSFEELLTTSTPTRQSLLATLTSGSSENGTDYRYFKNFTHFSSARKRVLIFKSKLELIESLESDIVSLNSINSGASGSLVAKQQAVNTVFQSFDGFEKYLYYGSGSVENYTGESMDLRYWPKSTTGTVLSVTSSISKEYYNDELFPSASKFDKENRNRLSYNLPVLISEDSNNAALLEFVDMMGHSYDIVHEHIANIKRKSFRDEMLNIGTPKTMLYEVARSMGWQLYNGKKSSKLYEYLAGQNKAGVKISKRAAQDITYETWNRIVNTLPTLFKNKSTRESFRMMMNIYGIPDGLIRIKEFGGSLARSKKIVEQYNTYSTLRFSNSGSYVKVPWRESNSRYPDTVSFMIRPLKSIRNILGNKVLLRSSPDGTGSLWNIKLGTDYDTLQGDLTLEISSSIGYETCTIPGEYLIEDFPTLLTIERIGATSQLSNEDVLYTLRATQQRYGEVTMDVSSSIVASGSVDARGQELNNAYNTESSLYFGENLDGYLYEIRYYSRTLDRSNRHTLVMNPTTFDSLFDDIILRHPIREKFNIEATGSLPSLHPEVIT